MQDAKKRLESLQNSLLLPPEPEPAEHEDGSVAPEEAEEPVPHVEAPAAEAEEAETPEPHSSGGKRAKRKLRRKKTRRLVLKGAGEDNDDGLGVGPWHDEAGVEVEKPSHDGEELGVELEKPSHDGEESGVELEKPSHDGEELGVAVGPGHKPDSASRSHGSQEDAQNPWATSSTPTKERKPKATPGSRSRRKSTGLTSFTPKSATPRKDLLDSFDFAAGVHVLSQTPCSFQMRRLVDT